MKRKKAKVIGEKDSSLKAILAIIEEVVSNEDLLIEILIRVPAKSLVRFKCVSKHWLSLISDQDFCYKHSACNPKVPSAIYYYANPWCDMLKPLSLTGHQNFPTLPLFAGNENQGTIRVIHSCNGLVLCLREGWYGEFLWVCILTTNKYTVLLQTHNCPISILLACICYEPAKSPYYKVVVTRNPNIIDIYSSEDKLWKHIYGTERLGRPGHKAFWDGSVHWLHHGKTHTKFDIYTETLTEFTLPPNLNFLSDDMIHYFGECGESLILIQYRARATLGFRILEMKKGATCWTVKQRANLRPVMHLYPENTMFHVLSVLKGRHGSDVVLVLAAAHKIFKYDLKRKQVDVICDFTESDSGTCNTIAITVLLMLFTSSKALLQFDGRHGSVLIL